MDVSFRSNLTFESKKDLRFAGLGLQPHQIDAAFRYYKYFLGCNITPKKEKIQTVSLDPLAEVSHCDFSQHGIHYPCCQLHPYHLPYMKELFKAIHPH